MSRSQSSSGGGQGEGHLVDSGARKVQCTTALMCAYSSYNLVLTKLIFSQNCQVTQKVSFNENELRKILLIQGSANKKLIKPTFLSQVIFLHHPYYVIKTIMISSELTLNHSALIKNMINNIYHSRDKKVFYAIEPNTIKGILKSLFIVIIAHAFLIYILYMLYKNIYLYVIEHPYVLSINKLLAIEAHAQFFTDRGFSW